MEPRHSYRRLQACRNGGLTEETGLVEILYFQHFYEHMTFEETLGHPVESAFTGTPEWPS